MKKHIADPQSLMKLPLIIVVLLTLALASACLFTACHFTAPTPFSPSPSAPPAPTGEETKQQPVSDPLPTQPVIEPTPTQSVTVALPNGPVPDSAYTLPQQPAHYYSDTVLELIPSDGYGRIWPYIGGYYDENGMGSSELIGICDEKGRIICDPVYNDVKLIENNGQSLYAFIKNDLLINEQYENMYITTLTPMNGSWTETFERVLWEESNSYEHATINDFYGFSRSYQWRDPLRYDYITARRGGRWGVLDWDGTLILPFKYLEPVCFHEGLASVLSEDKETFHFIDITGKNIIGPFQAPPKPYIEYYDSNPGIPVTDKIMFYEGRAKFYENGKYGIIDRSGNIVIPARYGFITCMNGGVAMFVELTPGGEMNPLTESFGVVNDTGAVIAGPTYPGQSVFYSSISGCAVIYKGNETYEAIAYNGTRTPYENKEPNIVGDFYVFEGSGLKLPLSKYYVSVINNNLVIVNDRENDTCQLVDYQGNPISPLIPGSLYYQWYGGKTPDYIYINTPNEWPTRVMVYSLDGKALLDDAFYTIKPIGDKFMVRGKNTAGLVGKDGSYTIQVSIAVYNID